MSLEHWVWLSGLRINKRWMQALLDRFVDPQKIYEATEPELSEIVLDQSARKAILLSRDLTNARNIISHCAKNHIGIVTMQDAAYPGRLRDIEVPPVLLYVSGRMPSFDEEAAITIVGTRSASQRAEEIAFRFGYELAEKGMLVISGMAKGIDAAANAGALSAGTHTVAVLGGGVDVCYPESSRTIYNRILDGNGCLISEYPPGDRPYASHFPERNRIMSGLSAGVLVIAAPERSGSLITASRALEQGREIFVVPGNVDEYEFVGSNNLIKHGAIPVTTPKDVVAYYYARFPDAFDDRKMIAYMRDSSGSDTMVPMKQRKKEPELHVASTPSYAIQGKTLPHRTQSREYDFGLFSAFAQKRKNRQNEKKKVITQTEQVENAPTAQIEQRTPGEGLPENYQKLIAIIMACEGRIAHIDELVNQSGFSAAETLSLLTEMELEGVVKALPGKWFQIIE